MMLDLLIAGIYLLTGLFVLTISTGFIRMWLRRLYGTPTGKSYGMTINAETGDIRSTSKPIYGEEVLK